MSREVYDSSDGCNISLQLKLNKCFLCSFLYLLVMKLSSYLSFTVHSILQMTTYERRKLLVLHIIFPFNWYTHTWTFYNPFDHYHSRKIFPLLQFNSTFLIGCVDLIYHREQAFCWNRPIFLYNIWKVKVQKPSEMLEVWKCPGSLCLWWLLSYQRNLRVMLLSSGYMRNETP